MLLVQVHDVDDQRNVFFIGRGRLIVFSDVDVVCSHKINLTWDYLGLLSFVDVLILIFRHSVEIAIETRL